MKAKWYISTLVVVLSLFGVNQYQISIPNQEIVVQFADLEVSSDDTDHAIAMVKTQLQSLGADNIQVKEETKGRLTITYYSASDVESIKKVLSKTNSTDLGITKLHLGEDSNKLPSEQGPNSYDLEVNEIQAESNSDWDLEGITVFQVKSENHRFFNPKVFATLQQVDQYQGALKVAYKVSEHVTKAIRDTSLKIPEVRAGPNS